MLERFEGNLARVRNIVALYEQTAGSVPGRPSIQEGDLLRSTVVFLHATLEDLLRHLAETHLAASEPDVLRLLPWPRAGSAKTTFDLGDLAAHRGQSVDQVIQHAVMQYLERSNFNHPGDIKRILEWVGMDPSLVDPFASELGAMMDRRHWIVHRGDRNLSIGSGHHATKSMSKSLVLRWVDVVEKFAIELLSNLPST